VASDDELRRVAEDVRALARSLGRDIRAALDRARDETRGPSERDREGTDASPGRLSAREDLAAAGRAARDELRAAQIAVRDSALRRRHGSAGRGPGPGGPPRWDNWGGYHHRGPESRRDRGASRGRARNYAATTPSAAAGYPERPPSPAAPPLRHRHDGTTLLGLLAVVFGLAWLAAGTHLASVSTRAVLAIALMVVGAATVVTARTDWALSRRSWPVVAGAAVAFGLVASAATPGLPVGFRHLEFGSQAFAPTTWQGLPPVIHGGVGTTTVQLGNLTTPLPEPRTLDIDNAAGRLDIALPNVPVRVEAQIAGGKILINGVVTAGVSRSTVETLNATADGATLTLHVRSGFGIVDIAGPSTDPGKTPPTPSKPDAPGIK